MLFAASQNFIDIKNKVEKERRDQSIRQELRKEIIDYDTLKNVWGLGHIECKFVVSCDKYCLRSRRPWHDRKNCPKTYAIIGHYRDYYEQTPRSVHLGHNYNQALSRMNHVKSFL